MRLGLAAVAMVGVSCSVAGEHKALKRPAVEPANVPSLASGSQSTTVNPNHPIWKKYGLAFDWNKAPVAGHFAAPDGFSDADVAAVLARYPLFTIARTTGRGLGLSSEKGFRQALQKFAAADPGHTSRILFYWNSSLKWDNYDANARYLPAYQLKDKTGVPVFAKDGDGDGGLPQHDHSNPDTRSWWANVAEKNMALPGADGVFADALVLGPGKRQKLTNLLGAEKFTALVQGYQTLLSRIKADTGGAKMIIHNGLRGRLTDWAAQDGGLEFLQNTDGAMLEHFGAFSSLNPDGTLDVNQMKLDIEMIGKVASMQKIVLVKAWPGFDVSNKPADVDAALVRNVRFPYAAFLMGTGEYSYFLYSYGYTLDAGWLADIPLLKRKIGAPLAPAVFEGSVGRRSFEHLDVSVDLATQRTTFSFK